MKKNWRWLFVCSGVILLLGILTSRWFWSLPFIPARWRDNFTLNANILPASDDSRSLFVAINPGFLAEFGDKDNPTSAFLRFEKTATSNEESVNADVNRNTWDSVLVTAALHDYQPGFSWQLFSVGIDETQWRAQTTLAADEQVSEIAHELLGEQLVATTTADLEVIDTQKQAIKTETVVERFQGYDVVNNRAVADDVDLRYLVVPGKGIRSEVLIGDRDDFNTACLKLLSLTGSDDDCRLPYNKLSFLLELDHGQRLIHSPLAIDGSNYGTYYVVDDEDRYIARLGNFAMTDQSGDRSDALTIEVRPGEVAGQAIDGFAVVTLTVDLNWLLDEARQFPVTVSGGFYVDGADIFSGELTEDNYLREL